MNHTNYNNHQETKIINLICLECDEQFKRKIPKLSGKDPTKGICPKCTKRQRKSNITMVIEGGDRRIRSKGTSGNGGNG